MGIDIHLFAFFNNPTSYRGLISKINRELKKLDAKIPNNPIKNRVQISTDNLNNRISNDQKTLKEMFTILNHQGNLNQNDSEIPSHTSQNG